MGESERAGQNHEPTPVDERTETEEVSGALLGRRQLFSTTSHLSGSRRSGSHLLGRGGGFSANDTSCSGSSFTCGAGNQPGAQKVSHLSIPIVREDRSCAVLSAALPHLAVAHRSVAEMGTSLVGVWSVCTAANLRNRQNIEWVAGYRDGRDRLVNPKRSKERITMHDEMKHDEHNTEQVADALVARRRS